MPNQAIAFAVAERLSQADAAFRQISAQLADAIAEMGTSDELPEVCRAYKALDDAYKGMDTSRKAVYAQLESISRETIPELLSEAKVTNITVEIGDLKYRFGKSQRVSVSMADKDAGMDWLRENGGAGIIMETVNSGTLSSFAKDFVKEKGMDLPDNLFKTSTLIYTSVTKAG